MKDFQRPVMGPQEKISGGKACPKNTKLIPNLDSVEFHKQNLELMQVIR